MKTIETPTREQVSPANQVLFDNLTKVIGSVPNLFAVFAKSEHALGNYLTLSNGKTSLRAKEKEVVNLVVSQVNGCEYCLSAHMAISKMQGFTDEQLLENFYAAGYNEGTLLDVVVAVGDKTITNYVYALTGVPIDFPIAPVI